MDAGLHLPAEFQSKASEFANGRVPSVERLDIDGHFARYDDDELVCGLSEVHDRAVGSVGVVFLCEA